jgi:hypothetical protein
MFLLASFAFTIDMEKVADCFEELYGSPHINVTIKDVVFNGQAKC